MDPGEYFDNDKEFQLAAYREKLERLLDDTDNMKSEGPPRQNMIADYRAKVQSLEGKIDNTTPTTESADFTRSQGADSGADSGGVVGGEEEHEGFMGKISDLLMEIKELKSDHQKHHAKGEGRKRGDNAGKGHSDKSHHTEHSDKSHHTPPAEELEESYHEEDTTSDEENERRPTDRKDSGYNYKRVEVDENKDHETRDHEKIQKLHDEQAKQKAESLEDHANVMMLKEAKEKQEREEGLDHEEIKKLRSHLESNRTDKTRSAPVKERDFFGNYGAAGENMAQDQQADNRYYSYSDVGPVEEPPEEVTLNKQGNEMEGEDEKRGDIMRGPIVKQRQKIDKPVTSSATDNDMILKEDSHEETTGYNSEVEGSEKEDTKGGVNSTDAVVLTLAAIAVMCALMFIVFTFLQ